MKVDGGVKSYRMMSPYSAAGSTSDVYLAPMANRTKRVVSIKSMPHVPMPLNVMPGGGAGIGSSPTSVGVTSTFS